MIRPGMIFYQPAIGDDSARWMVITGKRTDIDHMEVWSCVEMFADGSIGGNCWDVDYYEDLERLDWEVYSV